ncbi:Putative uncharacterized protein [Moritella viscosa]|nr:Putative uncharacterized protein [Moritella viscosa]SHO20936.1 Putative uncharacterized protein [Moritella viscosa]
MIKQDLKVHCRTGSLETIATKKWKFKFVHCRTGSLESQRWRRK